MAEIKKPKLNINKIALFSIALCILSMILLHLYANQGQEFIVKINEEKSMPNVTWVFEKLFLAFPVIILAAVQTAFYWNKAKYVPVSSQKEQMWISLITALFTYAVMLPYVYFKSKNGEVPEGEELEAVETLWDITYKWFFVQVIPFVILIAYHAVRADSEEKELSEAAV